MKESTVSYINLNRSSDALKQRTNKNCCLLLLRDMFPLSIVDKQSLCYATQGTSYQTINILPKLQYQLRLISEVRGINECQIASRELDYFSATTDC